LATKGTVRDARRIHLEHVERAVADRVLHVHQADDGQRPSQPGRGLTDLAERFSRHAPVRR